MAAVARRPRLLILRALGLGDLLTAVPALRALAAAFPRHRRILACPQALTPLVELSEAIDEVIDARPLAALPKSLHGVDVAVNLHGRGPQSHRALLALKPGRLIAFACGEAGVSAGPRWHAEEHEVHRWCRLLEESGVRADHRRLALPAPALELPERLSGVTVVHPGAAAPARRWPPERFAAVARAERAEGRQVAITGGTEELALASGVAGLAELPDSAVMAGRTELSELAGLVAGASRVICGDTGIAHLATAMGTPSIVIFGPTDPSRWGPPPDRARHRALWAGHQGSPHATTPDPGLLEIQVEDVLAELRLLRPASGCGGLPKASVVAATG